MNRIDNMKYLFVFILFSLGLHYSVLADGPDEWIHIKPDNIPTDLLKKTIGIITLNSGIKGGTSLNVFDDNFKLLKRINLRDNSKPISNFGYRYDNGPSISNFRYPIIALNKSFVKVSLDFEDSTTYWLSLDEIYSNFYLDFKFFQALVTDSEEFVSLFTLTTLNERKAFKLPSDNSDFIIITRAEYETSLISIVSQEGDFIKIGLVIFNRDNYEIELVKELGWIKIHDENGTLNIWIISKDFC